MYVHYNVAVSDTKLLEATCVAHAFTFQEIITITNNFSTILGKGGFGFVFMGTLENGVDVAVKVLSNASQQGEREFLNEVFNNDIQIDLIMNSFFSKCMTNLL